MGKVTEWLRRLLGGRRKTASDGKEKKGWGFVRSLRDKESGVRKVVGGNGRNGSSYTDVDLRCCSAPCDALGGNGGSEGAIARAYDEEEQSKRAIAMAAATAAVAEAAVAAAQAAAAVVRLTSRKAAHGGVPWRREEWAAIKIQAAFRGYLGRRALKALKGLVKIQALVRGHIVRKQAAETLRCMHALVRAQARARVGRAVDNQLNDNRGSKRHSFRNVSKVNGHWLEERYWDTRESMTRTIDEKILEIDAGRPRANPKWRSIHHTLQHPDPNSRSFTTLPESPSKDEYSTAVQRSVPSPSSVDMQPSLGSIMFPLEGVEYTESPQFYSASSRHGSSRRGPFTPSKSECSRSLFGGYSDYPNYMANTESSRAKLRSQSAPRQRPERERSGGVGPAHRGGSLHLKFAGKTYPGSGRLDRMGLPVGV